MSKRKKIDMSKLCLKSKPPTGVPAKIQQFFTPNEPSTSSSTEISRPLVESVNIHPQPVSSIENALKAYEHTKDKIKRLGKRKSDLSPLPIASFFEPINNVSVADFESPKRKMPTVIKSIAQPKTKRATNINRLKQNSIKKKLLQNNKTEESLFSELLAQQCASENIHPDELQMALALSKSLVETFTQEASTSNESAVSRSPENRFSDIQKTLENFGFKSAGQYSAGDMKTILRVKNYKWRKKFSKRNLDYMRKPFEEKLSMVLAENAERNEPEDFSEYVVHSEMLREMRTRSEDTLFKLQSSDVHSSKLMDRYYTGNLFEVSTVRNDYLLKNWDEIPGRTPSPVKRSKFDLSRITELSEEVSQDCLQYPEYNSGAEMEEVNNKNPIDVQLLSSRNVGSPDLFSDSDAEIDDTNKTPTKHSEIFNPKKEKTLSQGQTDNSAITHFESYTSEEAKIKDIVPSRLCESNVDIFADLSVDMIDLTSECESHEEDNAMSPTVLMKRSKSQFSIEKKIKIVSQQESVFTLSSDPCMSESGRSEFRNDTDSLTIPILTEPDSIVSNSAVAIVLDTKTDNQCRGTNDKDLPASDQFNTQDITLVYSEDESSNEIEGEMNQENVSNSIVVLSEESDDETESIETSPIISQTKASRNHSVVTFIELPHFSENTLIDVPMDVEVLPAAMTQNFIFNNFNNSSSGWDRDIKLTQLTEERNLFQLDEIPANFNSQDERINESPCINNNDNNTNFNSQDVHINESPFINNNDTQNITLVFSEDENSNENREPYQNLNLSNNLSNGFKTPPRQHSIFDFSDTELPNLNKNNEVLQNLTHNISDSIEISDDEVNYSTAQINQVTPSKTPGKSIIIDSDDESDLAEISPSILGKSMHSFLRSYERKLSEDIDVIEDGNDENNEANKSVNEFLFKSRFESMEKRPNISLTKPRFKRYPSEPSFSRAERKTPKKLCFDQLKNDDEFDRLVFGEKINHDVVVLSPKSPLRDIPKSPEPLSEEYFEELNYPYNYFQPDDEYDIVLNQNTPKVNLNGTIDMNETLYDGEKYIYKTRNVTPEPHYNSMDIGKLHVELKKYGLKKISRVKAIKLLEYIYNETHPIIQDTDKESTIDCDHHKIASSQPVKQTNRSPTKRTELPTTQIIGTWSGIDFSACNRNIDYFKTDNFTLNLLNINEIVYLPSKPRSGKFQYCALPLHIAFFNLFRSNSKLRNALFMYQPIEVEKLYFYFKSIGAKYEMNDLISFLDRHCITFRTDPKNKSSGARTKK